MGKKVKKRKIGRKTTLFGRIMTGLTLPLLILAAIFIALQLTGELRAMSNTQRVTNRLAIDSIHQGLANKTALIESTEELKQSVLELQDFHKDVSITLFDLLSREVLVAHGTEWSEFDSKALETALYEQQRGKAYIVRIHQGIKKVTAYIPLNKGRKDPAFVVRLQFPLANIGAALKNSRITLIFMIIIIIITGIVIGRRLSKSIVKPIQELNEATQEIVKGNLGKHVHIHTGDEIETLSHTFNEMSDALKSMKQKAVDSNPLTGLPGNQGIFQQLKQRILERQKFVLFHTDLDRFKVFNDHFGLAKGDEAIKETARILERAIEAVGAEDDFVGHQGGDDYVVITRPHKAKEVAEYIIREFDDKAIKALYKPEDIKRGYILQLDRRHLAETGEERMVEFPLLALSLAGVTNSKKDFADYFDCMSQAVAVKKLVKKEVNSSYTIKE